MQGSKASGKARKAAVSQKNSSSTRPCASLSRRLAALFYDWILLLGVFFLTTLVLLVFRNGQAFPAGDLTYLGALYLSGQFFFSWFWIHGGQTLGMRAWKIRLVSTCGSRPNLVRTLMRGAFATSGGLVFGLGYFWALIDPARQTLQDIASRTRIINE